MTASFNECQKGLIDFDSILFLPYFFREVITSFSEMFQTKEIYLLAMGIFLFSAALYFFLAKYRNTGKSLS